MNPRRILRWLGGGMLLGALLSGRASVPNVARAGTPACDPSYPTVCIPPFPPDLDCDEVPYARFAVRGADPHGFDRDRDGIGCE